MGSLRLITTSVFLLLLIIPAEPETVTYHKKSKENHEIYGFQITDREIKEKLAEFLAALQNSESSKTNALQIWFDSLIKSDLINNRTDLSDAFYFIGFHHMNNSDYQLSYKYMLESANIRENLGLKDTRYRRALLNMGTILIVQGKFREAVTNYESLIDFITEQDGENSADNILNYNNLASAYNELKMFEKAIEAALKGIESYELNKNAEGITPVELLRLYNNLGISYSRRNDYSRAKLHLSRAYEIVKDNPGIDISLYVNIVNSLTISNTKLGEREEARALYNDAYSVAVRDASEYSLLLVSNYAYFLAEEGRLDEAENIMNRNVTKALSVFGDESRIYYDMVERFSLLLSRYNIDSPRALDMLEYHAIPYVLKNREDILLLRNTYHTYAIVLRAENRYKEALMAIQTALYPHLTEAIPGHDNPGRADFTPDRTGLALLKDKVEILRDIWLISQDTIYLAYAIETNRYLISSVETVRIEMSEEESRNLLGDNYREVYDGIIADLYRIFQISNSQKYFRLAFEYAERSKAAGLLVSIREIKASQFLIPDSLSGIERELERELGVIREMISREMSRPAPDRDNLTRLKEEEYQTVQRRSALTSLFEKEYPEYYTAKYNTEVAGIDDILKRTGKHASYLNYVFTDTMLYAFVINHRHTEMVGIRTDSTLFQSINQFRSLLLKQSSKSDHRLVFKELSLKGYELYETLLMPVQKFIDTEKLIVSPDNILAYIPFETLVSTSQPRDDLYYRKVDFLLKKYEISYTYSATMFIESDKRRKAFRNPALALAPVYSRTIHRDSVINSRQVRQDILFDLPYAREEAAYVAARLGGELYINNEARESVYKDRASHFPVLHLAMHTVINDNSPAYSRLIFSDIHDGAEDGFLNAYEIYGIPVSAAMVVISSCNTGSGKLRAGEGVMSLARAFINAGSQSVVMSLWEVDDKWGQQVIISFYDNLKTGMSKSHALRKARLDFLENSSQFQSHPYYWSTLVLYGNDTPLFYDLKRVAVRLLLKAILLFLTVRIVYRVRSK